jgi:hypothetical protein
MQHKAATIWYELNKDKQNQKITTALLQLIVIGYQHKDYKLVDAMRLDLVPR